MPNIELEYWKPEPKRHGFAWWALLLPAIVYSVGVVVYAHNAFVPGMAQLNGHALGSALMVFGGEAGTLAAAAEVFRKSRANETNAFDWVGLFVSLAATLGNLFVVYVSLADMPAWWLLWVRANGPLVLLLCSGVDFYAGIMEFGFYNASFDERWEKWNEGEHEFKMRERNRKKEDADGSKPSRRETKPEVAQPSVEDLQKQVLDNLLLDSVTKAVFDAISVHPDATQSLLAEISGYSRTTVANKLKLLRSAGVAL